MPGGTKLFLEDSLAAGALGALGKIGAAGLKAGKSFVLGAEVETTAIKVADGVKPSVTQYLINPKGTDSVPVKTTKFEIPSAKIGELQTGPFKKEITDVTQLSRNEISGAGDIIVDNRLQSQFIKNRIDKTTGIVKDNSQLSEYHGFLNELESWPALEKAVTKLPDGFKFSKYTDGLKTIGLEFRKDNVSVTIKKAKHDAEYSSQMVDYATVKYKGNNHVATNGDHIFENKGSIARKNPTTGEVTKIPDGVYKGPSYLPEVHVPLDKLDDVLSSLNKYINSLGEKK